MKSIGLCMIVKNEAHVITRCLDSVRPFVDYVLVEDTGSTDGTQEIICSWLGQHDIPGAVIEEPWRDFAYNRTHVMEALRKVETVDYAFIIDADDALVLEEGFDPAAFKREMHDDLYDVQIRHGGTCFLRPQLSNNRMPFCFKAVLHEYLEAPPGELKRSHGQGFHIQTGRGGARNNNPRKYQDDAAALEKGLLTETDPFLISRYTFYLAQSYRDYRENEKALANYLKRAEQGFWAEEIFYSLYQAGKIQESAGFPPEEVIATYLRATDASPSRAEALHAAARYCRSLGRNEEGYQYAKRGAEKPLPVAGLFTESWIYDNGLLDEVGINGYWSGHYREALNSCLRLLGGSALPANQRERIMRNAQFSLAKLPGLTAAAKTGTSVGAASLMPIHLINLDRSADRLTIFRKRNAHLGDVVRFPGVDGRLLDREKLAKDGVMAPDCDYKLGAIGCALSHVSLWRTAVDENRIITVFEDDAVATYRFEEKAAQIISTLPEDWDFIQWGYIFDPLFVWVDFGFSKANLQFYDGADKSKFQSADLSASAVRLAHSYGSQAYSLSPNGARLLLESCLPLSSRVVPFPGTGILAENTGIDCAMCGVYGSIRAFVCIPPLVLHDQTQNSDLRAVDRESSLVHEAQPL